MHLHSDLFPDIPEVKKNKTKQKRSLVLVNNVNNVRTSHNGRGGSSHQVKVL